MVRDPSRRRLALADRLIEVIDDRQTGETLLDEALKMMKSSEKYGTGAWVDLMSGESSQASAWTTFNAAKRYTTDNANPQGKHGT